MAFSCSVCRGHVQTAILAALAAPREAHAVLPPGAVETGPAIKLTTGSTVFSDGFEGGDTSSWTVTSP